MVQVAVELANLLQAERLEVKRLKDLLVSQSEAVTAITEERQRAIDSAIDAQVSADEWKANSIKLDGEVNDLKDKVNELLIENKTLCNLADAKGREASDLRDTVGLS